MGNISEAACCHATRPLPNPDLVLLPSNSHPDDPRTVTLVVNSLDGIPLQHRILEKMNPVKSGVFVEVHVELKNSTMQLVKKSPTLAIPSDGSVLIPDITFSISSEVADRVQVSVWFVYLESQVASGIVSQIGEASVAVSELASQQQTVLWMFNSENLLVYSLAAYQTQPLSVTIINPRAPPDVPPPACAKHVMVLSRGTRGDVQPFLALARGLAEKHNWRITVCTEMRYRDLVMKNAKVSAGNIGFCPSGGDTETRIDRPIAKWWMSQSNRAFQVIMLANAEREFFESEPAFHYFASKLKPDVLMFGFNTANLAMIVSESLSIPTVGFILQPTVVPSTQYPAVVPIGQRYHVDPRASLENIAKLREDNDASDPPLPSRGSQSSTESDEVSTSRDPGESPEHQQLWDLIMFESSDLDSSHLAYGVLKTVFENNVFTAQLNAMRASHGLPSLKTSETDFQVLSRQDVPLIVPINAKCFGGHPPDWPLSMKMTDFIYLSPTLGPGQEPLALLQPELRAFIQDAKAASKPLVLIAFSSMPIARNSILALSTLVAEKSAAQPRIIAVVGQRPHNESTRQDLEKRAAQLKADQRLIEIAGAPFGIVFPLVDFLVLHGGLGTTSEAFRAGKPFMVTGILVLDQRFWGRRVAELGMGPDPCLLRKLPRDIIKHVDYALTPGNDWEKNAKVVAEMLKKENHGDGVELNCQAVIEAVGKAKVVKN